MVVVLGCYWHSDITIHNTSACVIKDGKILAAINEDRITRIKLDSSPPRNAIKEVLRIANIKPSEVDAVAVPFYSPFKSWVHYFTSETDIYKQKMYNFIGGYPMLKFLREFRLKQYLRTLGIQAPIHYVRHHLAHAAFSYFTSGMKEALILTLDGSGDGESTSIKIGRGKEIIDVASSKPCSSLGTFYTKVTTALGFQSGNEEGKVTGLAAYGKPLNIFDGNLWVDGLKIKGEFRAKRYKKLDIDNKIVTVSKSIKYNSKANELLKSYPKEDVAASIQHTLEKLSSQLTKNAIRKTGVKDICLGGGVALNVKMNSNLSKLAGDFYIPFEPSDTGTPIGAALYVNSMLGNFNPEKVETSYYGTEYSDEEIVKVLEEWHLGYEKVNPSKAGADLVKEGKVIGFFQGKMEAGPRTLGNRSCLARADDKNMRDKINKHLKCRDWFMPFAPSCLEDKKEEYFEDARESPFMMMNFNVKDGINIPAASHVDRTARPQTVTEKQNKVYYDLIKSCGGIILNTSFNKHGEPVVRSPQDALLHLMRFNVQALIIGNYLVRHPNEKKIKKF